MIKSGSELRVLCGLCASPPLQPCQWGECRSGPGWMVCRHPGRV